MASQPPTSRPDRRGVAVLAHSPRLFRILESIGEGVIVTDATGTIDDVAVLEPMTGWPAAEVIGRTIGEVFPTELETGVPRRASHFGGSLSDPGTWRGRPDRP